MRKAEPRQLNQHKGSILTLAFSFDERRLFSTDTTNELLAWDLAGADPRSTPLRSYQNGSFDFSGIAALVPSQDGRWLVTGARDASVQVWDLNNLNTPPRVLHGHEDEVDRVALSNDNHWAVSVDITGGARLWDLLAPSDTVMPLVLTNLVAIGPDQAWIAARPDAKQPDLWELGPSNTVPTRLLARSSTTPPVALQAAIASIGNDFRPLAVSDRDSSVLLYDNALNYQRLPGGNDIGSVPMGVQAEQHLFIRNHTFRNDSVVLSDDYHWLLVGHRDGEVQLWDLHAANSVPVATIPKLKDDQPINQGRFSPDGHWLVVASDAGNQFQLWALQDSGTLRLVGNLDAGKGTVLAAGFSPDSHWLLTTATATSTAYLWDLRAANPAAQPHPLIGHQREIDTFAFSPNNRWLVTAARTEPTGEAVHLWDLSATEPASTGRALEGYSAGLINLLFTDNSQQLFASGYDNLVYRWDLTSSELDQPTQRLVAQGNGLLSLALSHDGRWLVAGSNDGQATLWDLHSLPPTFNSSVLHTLDAGEILDMVFSKVESGLLQGMRTIISCSGR